MRIGSLLIIFLGLLTCPVIGQKVLQIEKFGRAKTKKIFPGEEIRYQLKGSDDWFTSVIIDLKVDQNIIELSDRYISMPEVTAIRYEKRFGRSFGKQLFWFGGAWSLFALGGAAAYDDQNYRWSDAIVTGSAWALSFVFPKLFRHRTYRFGKKRRLRMLDLNFHPQPGF